MRWAALLLTAALSTWTFAQAPATLAPISPQPQAVPSSWPTAQYGASKDEGVQKAYAMLNQMIRALGGDTYLSVRNMQSEGRTYGFYHGQPRGMGTVFWRFWEWPDKERLELTKQRDVTELFNGDKGYEITYKGTAEQDPKELQDYLRRREHSLEWVIRRWLSAPKTMILYAGTALVERNLADQVTVLNADNDSVTISIDSTTHLPVKIAYSWRDPVDRQFDDESVVFSNYKPVQGVQTPYSTVRNLNGEMSNQRFITAVTYNTDMSPTLFEPKGSIYAPGKQPPK